MGVEMLTERLYRLLLGPLQAYLWRDAGGVTLIDTGPVDSGAEIAAALDELGLAPGDLDRVVLNLLSNAVKFTDDRGRVVVELGLGEAPDPARAPHVVLSVRDSGIGISQEQQHRLFERFFRSVEAQQAAIQGTGLGLAVCKAIVDTHGGTIRVDSEVGVGTTVTVSLPTAV